ncbi:PLP-dependent aminotransferase family protein [Microbacterium sediminis]|uniref:GntR family transcriptional regulator n=1 Tax=Microbacterium sediminis TaxID=904291 RepID=A0A1B9N904_9MICO|nr:PLP-dependent aminotransferase family protein [Microbacterium sediminis]OCG73075.1 GntR family transcriptional regulator [Microbacterium sediminis]
MFDSSSDRIASELRAWSLAAPPGARLPSTRELVARYEASPVTVQKALRLLAAQGIVETRPGVGTFTRALRTARPGDCGWQTGALGSRGPLAQAPSAGLRAVPNDVIALHSGYPERELLPERLVRAALARASRGETAVDRAPSAGLPALQEWFASELAAATSAGLTAPAARDVVVVPGSQSALSTLFRALVGAGRPLVIESPTYWGALLAAAQVGVELIPVPSGPNGPDPEEVERAFAQSSARAFYAQPTYANPTGAQWSPGVVTGMLDIVRRHGAFLIEDDWARDFGITTDPAPVAGRDDAGHVIHLRSLTKSLSPAIRVAAIIARGPARDRILADVQAHAMYVSGVLQAAALDVVTQPGWSSHLRGLRPRLRSRRDLMVDAVQRHLPGAHLEAIPPGGLNLWLRLPDDTDLPRLARTCEERGVLIAPGGEWFPAEPPGCYLRLNYSGASPAAFDDAARIIGEALEGAAG